jgi:hypothetical protein
MDDDRHAALSFLKKTTATRITNAPDPRLVVVAIGLVQHRNKGGEAALRCEVSSFM